MRGRAALFAAIVAVAAIAALAAGMAVIGSPAENRERRLDAQRTADLRLIAEAVEARMVKTDTLPASLHALKTADQRTSFRLTDPVTGEPYEYIAIGPRAYQLCATFSHPTRDGDDGTRYPRWTPDFWHHGAGRHCFSVIVAVATPK